MIDLFNVHSYLANIQPSPNIHNRLNNHKYNPDKKSNAYCLEYPHNRRKNLNQRISNVQINPIGNIRNQITYCHLFTRNSSYKNPFKSSLRHNSGGIAQWLAHSSHKAGVPSSNLGIATCFWYLLNLSICLGFTKPISCINLFNSFLPLICTL